MPRLEPYSRKSEYSYALGIFPSLELMNRCPERAQRLLISPEGLGNEGVEKLRRVCREAGVREEEAGRVLKRESRKDNCYAGIVFEKFEDELVPSPCHVFLDHISDAGNLGTILRTLLGFGVKDVALSRPCTDPFDPHVIRASMGARFGLRLHIYDAFEQYLAAFPEREYYPFMLDASVPLEEGVRMKNGPFTLIFGNEATGLPPEFSRYGQPVRIPQTADVDSLNLSIACAVGTYRFLFTEV